MKLAMLPRASLAIVLACGVVTGRALEQTTSGCVTSPTGELNLTTCTRLIDSGTLSGHELAAALSNRGQAYAANGNYALAVADYSRAIQIDPGFTDAYTNRALTEVQTKAFSAAIADAEAALRIDANARFAHLALAFAYSGTGQSDAAIKEYTLILDANPNSVPTRLNRGGQYIQKESYDLAIADYTEVLRHDPNNAVAFLNRGMALYATQRYADALRDFAAAQAMDASNRYAPLWLYLARERAGQPKAIGSSELAKNSAKVDLSKWPGLIIRAFLGKIKPAAVIASAKSAGEQCEALFYLGELSITRNEPLDGQNRLQQAAKMCPRDFIEFHVARTELLSSVTSH